MDKVDEIVELFRTKVKDDNISEVVSNIRERLNSNGKDADLYTWDRSSGSTIHMSIGINQIGRMTLGGKKSSINEFISDNIKLNAQDGMLADIVNLYIDDCTEAYENLIMKIQKLENTSFDDIMMAVYSTVNDYFGGIEKVSAEQRAKYYEQLGNLEKDAKLSDFKGKNLAACVERAGLSQNLLKFLGFNAICKSSQITIDGKRDAHNYNLVEYKAKYYIFDATIPNKDEKGNVSPIVAEIPKDVFEKLSDPMHKDDVAIVTEHDSVRGYRKICYNSWSKNVYDARILKSEPNDSDDKFER